MEIKRNSAAKDLVLIGIIAAIGLCIATAAILLSGNGSTVQVRVDGKISASYPLSIDIEADITGAGGTNRLVIHDGEAWIESASCPDGICVRTGRISKNGQSIICLPNKVVVEIVSDKTDQTGRNTDVIVR